MLIHIWMFIFGFLLFFLGLRIFKRSLRIIPHDFLARALEELTTTPLRGTIVATLITAVIQSSSAVMVITVGFVDAGILTFSRAIGIVLGTNIGTCITAQIISSELTSLALPLLFWGSIFFLWKKNLGKLLIGLGIVFEGLHLITYSSSPLTHSQFFWNTMALTEKRPIMGVLIGTIAAAIIQSSSVIVGLSVALSQNNLLSFNAAVPLIMGSNLGTCFTALLASIGSTKVAKKVAFAHVLLNLLGIVIFFPLLNPFSNIVKATSESLPRQIANAHTLFNVLSTLLILPFASPFAKLSSFLYEVIIDFMQYLVVLCTKLKKVR